MDTPDFDGFIKQAKAIFENRIYTDYLHCFAYGVDASCYSYVPQAVVRAFDENEIKILFNLSQKYRTPLTFRAAGTSLSGQACTDSVLVIANSRWQNIEISPDAESIFCDCGVIGCEANEALKPFGKKIGPDPATINNAMIGGIFSNNSSGMCCGVKQNSYNTIKSIRVILHDASVLDTSSKAKDGEDIQTFLHNHKDKVKALLSLRDEILKDKNLSTLIRSKFAIKNTTGYSINALLDFEDIKNIINHIFVGAEGTLGFVSRVEYECVDDNAFKAASLLFYENLKAAAKAVGILANNESVVSAAEMMDYACLKSAKDLEDAPEILGKIKKGQCALLVQLEDSTQEGLESKIDFITNLLLDSPSLFGTSFSKDEAQMASWWKIRKSLLPLSASLRPSGSIVITEDICFPIEFFADGIEAITRLFERFDYDGIIFGHALSGNVHFIITPFLDSQSQSERFGAFMEALVDSVLKLKGSLKAEHGTGRMMAPFVEKEWGAKAYEINCRIKHIFDSGNLINPDVIISNNPHIHLENLKDSTQVEDFINQCMECGFCEKVCPSRELTLSPRQRIAVRKEIARLENIESKSKVEIKALDSLKKGYIYDGVDTCATCSMCATLCPLEIDTARVALELKPTMVGALGTFLAHKTSKNFKATLKLLKGIIGLSHTLFSIFGANRVSKWSKKLRLAIKSPYMPHTLPNSNNYNLTQSQSNDSNAMSVIYFSTCINRVFAPSKKAFDKRSLQEAFESVCKKASVKVIYPHNLDNMCCGKAYKDYKEVSKYKAQEAYDTLRALALELGNVAIVCDHSACSYEMLSFVRNLDSKNELKIYDMPQFIESVLLHRLHITPKAENIALYAMCATKKGKWDGTLEAIAKACVNGNVIKHNKTQCCGFAGNKGFICPELNESALRELKDFYNLKQDSMAIKRGFASSSTCEIGLNEKTNISWQNILYLVDEVSAAT